MNPKKPKASTKRPRRVQRRLDSVVLLDDDGVPVRAGDIVRFNYGIPPVVVDAQIVKRHGRLIALTPGHNPAECNLRTLRKYVGNWYKQNTKLTGGLPAKED